MKQQGSIRRKGPSWFLVYRENFIENGKMVRKQRVVRLCEYSDRYRCPSDLDDLVQEKMAGVRSASKCPASADSFINYVETVYLPFVQRKMKPSTFSGYRSYWLRYIKPHVAPYSLRDFTVAIISRLLSDVASLHSVNVDTLGKVRSILSGIFTYALGRGDFPGTSSADNPASCALIPETATEPGETVAASRQDVIRILQHLDKQKLTLARAAVAVIAYTGCRPGEARGLRWEDWDRGAEQIHIQRSVWHTVESTPKTKQSVRYVAIAPELRSILLDLWKSQDSPLGGYILARANGERVNLDNESKRVIRPALRRCGICHESELKHGTEHRFELDAATSMEWTGWYSLRRFHGTAIREEAGNTDTMSKALGNSKAVADKHYLKNREVLSDVRKAVYASMSGLIQ